jgi:hypothetical protein
MRFDENGQVLMTADLEWAVSAALTFITDKTGFDFETADTAFEMYVTQPTETYSVWVQSLKPGMSFGGANAPDIEDATGEFWLAQTSPIPFENGFVNLQVRLVSKAEFQVHVDQMQKRNGKPLAVDRISIVKKSDVNEDQQRRMEQVGHNNLKVRKPKRRQVQASRRKNRK